MAYRIEYSPDAERHLRTLTARLRIENLRVYYDVDEPESVVRVLAVGVKERNRVRIGKDVMEL